MSGRARAGRAHGGDEIRLKFESVLFEHPLDAQPAPEPDYFGDLNLDQVLAALTAGRAEYELDPFFRLPLHDAASVQYRHEAMQDLERDELRACVAAFGGELRRMREHLEQAKKLHYELQRQALHRDAVEVYCDAVRALGEGLAELKPASRALTGLAGYLAAHIASEEFASLAAEAWAVKEALAGVRYAVWINGDRVTVARDEGEPDYGAEVERTFAKFAQGSVRSHAVRLNDTLELDGVEEKILTRVARLHPEVFRRLEGFCLRWRDYLDPTIARFDREVQLYLGYLELIAPLRAAGLPFSYPSVSTDAKETAVEDAFDLALALKLVPERRPVVGNDLRLDGPERVFVVTGPNNGGKTTFARTFGQLHHLAGLGLPVPGRRARLYLPDRIYTHFEREEEIETLRGKFEDELVRVHAILERATAGSVIVMNESFGSTTLNDALYVGGEVMRQILELGCLGLYVTFVDELASLGEATVSVVSQIVPENPAERTFKLLRTPADGLAYAWALADRYGLTYERLLERVA